MAPFSTKTASALLSRPIPSWTEFSADEECNDAATLRKRFSWRVRSCAREELLLQLLPRNSAVRAVADELLGAAEVPIKLLASRLVADPEQV